MAKWVAELDQTVVMRSYSILYFLKKHEKSRAHNACRVGCRPRLVDVVQKVEGTYVVLSPGFALERAEMSAVPVARSPVVVWFLAVGASLSLTLVSTIAFEAHADVHVAPTAFATNTRGSSSYLSTARRRHALSRSRIDRSPQRRGTPAAGRWLLATAGGDEEEEEEEYFPTEVRDGTYCWCGIEVRVLYNTAVVVHIMLVTAERNLDFERFCPQQIAPDGQQAATGRVYYSISTVHSSLYFVVQCIRGATTRMQYNRQTCSAGLFEWPE